MQKEELGGVKRQPKGLSTLYHIFPQTQLVETPDYSHLRPQTESGLSAISHSLELLSCAAHMPLSLGPAALPPGGILSATTV